MNSKRDRFKRVAEIRTNRILEYIRRLSNCSNKSSYDYDESNVKKIFSVIEIELKKAKKMFENSLENKNKKFTLD